MNEDLQKLAALPVEETEEDWIDAACRENREKCNNLTDEERQHLMDTAMSIVYGQDVPSPCRS